MSLSFLDNIDYNGRKPNFNRDLFDTVAQMKAFSENYLPDVFIASCKADGKQYVYNKNNTVDETTGKWRLLTSGGSGGGAVDSVNGKTGAVTLTASDVGALADSTAIPSKTSDLTNDSNFVVDANYQHTDNNFTNDLKTAYDGAVTDKHTHSNKTVLDAITSEVKSGYDSAVTNSHSHDNKTVIDKFTESADGKPLYDGNAIGGSGGTTIVVGNGGDSYYSEDEIVIGSYLGKPLYRKTVIKEKSELTSGGWKDFPSLIPNAETVVKIDSLIVRGSTIDNMGYRADGAPMFSAEAYNVGTETAGLSIYVYSTIYSSLSRLIVVVDYTKTTDTANSSPIARPTVYSTDEVCGGTWIDGKPLYRKVVTNIKLTQTGWTDIPNVITGCNFARVVSGYAENSGKSGSYFMPEVVSTSQHVSYYIGYNGNLAIYVANSALLTYTHNVIIEYTKTTD